MTAVHPPRSAPTPDDVAVSIAARLCWHAFRICQAMAVSLDSLQNDLDEISAHCDALIEMAIELDRQGVGAGNPQPGERP